MAGTRYGLTCSYGRCGAANNDAWTLERFDWSWGLCPYPLDVPCRPSFVLG